MHSTRYLLRAKSGGWTTHPDAHSRRYRLLEFDMTAERHGKPLGGHNIQVILVAPDQLRKKGAKEGHDKEDAAMRLASGWWVFLRNQFAQAPDVALTILASIQRDLSAITAEATTARGKEAEAMTDRLWSMTFEAVGPDYWR